jgi:hypothetical protein
MSRRGGNAMGSITKRKKLSLGSQLKSITNRSKTKPLTKKQLEKFDEANTRDYLSDEGEKSANYLLNIIFRANAQPTYPHKKQVQNIIKGGKR